MPWCSWAAVCIFHCDPAGASADGTAATLTAPFVASATGTQTPPLQQPPLVTAAAPSAACGGPFCTRVFQPGWLSSHAASASFNSSLCRNLQGNVSGMRSCRSCSKPTRNSKPSTSRGPGLQRTGKVNKGYIWRRKFTTTLVEEASS